MPRRRWSAVRPSPRLLPWVIASRTAESPAARPAAPSQSMVPVVAARPRRDDQHHDRDDQDREGGGQPEHAVVAGAVVHQQADDDETGPAAEAQRARQHRHRRHHPVFGQLLAQDRDADRVQRERGAPAAPAPRSAAASDDVVAASTEPTSTTASTTSSTRFLLCRSASRPINGVAAAAASRFAVTAQLTATVDASSWSAMMPSTGTTAVCRTATVRTTTLSPATSAGRRLIDMKYGARRFGLDHATLRSLAHLRFSRLCAAPPGRRGDRRDRMDP